MSSLCLVRHGQSLWNKENKFTGWIDIDLTEEGKLEAQKSGEFIKKGKYNFDIAYTSILIRANHTLDIILKEINQSSIEIKKSWLINERHYGALQGLNKQETAKKYGKDQVHAWRRGYDIKPPPLKKSDKSHPKFDELFKNIPTHLLPDSESLKDTYKRTIQYWDTEMVNSFNQGKNILIVAHGNSLRALCKYLLKIEDSNIQQLEIPTGNPLIIEFENKKIKKIFYLDEQRKNELPAV